jgi:hypothetical protein
MARQPGKATKIAYKILGIPQNIQNDKSAFNKKVKRGLRFEETRRSR